MQAIDASAILASPATNYCADAIESAVANLKPESGADHAAVCFLQTVAGQTRDLERQAESILSAVAAPACEPVASNLEIPSFLRRF